MRVNTVWVEVAGIGKGIPRIVIGVLLQVGGL